MPLCADCGTERPKLHRHHVVPRSQGGSDDQDNIILICANCHEDRHGGPHGGTSSHTAEARAKLGDSMRRRWQNPEYRAKIAASWTPTRRARMVPVAAQAREKLRS
jgi:hypothetical protein